MTAPANPARVFEVAAELEGTTRDLKDVATEAERDNLAFLEALDEQVMLCDACGWWCASEDVNENGNCNECQSENDCE